MTGMNSEWDVERRRLESNLASYLRYSVSRDLESGGPEEEDFSISGAPDGCRQTPLTHRAAPGSVADDRIVSALAGPLDVCDREITRDARIRDTSGPPSKIAQRGAYR